MSNSTIYSDIKFGLHDNAERYIWVAYLLFVLLSSLIGDTLILAASFQKDAFKINQLIVTVIQQLAVSDLINSIFIVLPTATSLVANSWILGHTICKFQSYLIFFVNPVCIWLIAVLTTFKFLILRHPLQASRLSTKSAHQVCVFVWVICFSTPILMVVADKGDVYFDYRTYNCSYDFNDDFWKYLLPPMTLIFSLAPNLVVFLTTVPTLKYLMAARKSARRSQGHVPWQGAITVALTAIVYTISTLPGALYQFLNKFIPVQEHSSDCFHVKFFRIGAIFMMINTMANFYIYSLTIKSFRRFLLSKVQLAVSIPLNSSRNTKNPRETGNVHDFYFYLNFVTSYYTCITLWYPIYDWA